MVEMTSKTKLITNDIKDLLTITLKPRHDPIGDQYSRIFMVKVLLVCTMVIGVNQYKDTVSCIIPESLDICGDDQPSCDFIQAACWIQGGKMVNILAPARKFVESYFCPIFR